MVIWFVGNVMWFCVLLFMNGYEFYLGLNLLSLCGYSMFELGGMYFELIVWWLSFFGCNWFLLLWIICLVDFIVSIFVVFCCVVFLFIEDDVKMKCVLI